MYQVLFWIPIRTEWTPQGIPVYGFGVMLFCAFVFGSWIAGRLGRRVGVPKEKLQDFLICIFVVGLLGGRVLYMVAEEPDRWSEFFRFWNGGLVFYGGAIGGTIGGLIAYRWLLKPLRVSPWQVCDVLAPAIALGLCFGRLGCFFTGCCYGHVAPPGSPEICFPAMTSPATQEKMLSSGFQLLAGFAMDDKAPDDRTVGFVEAGSPAQAVGLKPGDVIMAVNGLETPNYATMNNLFRSDWPRGERSVTLAVKRGAEVLVLEPYVPRLIGLHPTQVYESISGFLLFIALSAMYPVRRYDGQLIVWLMFGYAIQRFIIERLRDDTPKFPPLGLSLSQSISLGIVAAASIIWLLRRRQPRAAMIAS